MLEVLSSLTPGIVIVLILVLIAEAANGWSDAPVGTSSAVASGALKSRQALILTAFGNLAGLLVALFIGSKVAKTIGTGIVQPEFITIAAIGVAMVTSILWSFSALWLGVPISKTHSLLAALAGIGWAAGGLEALMPASGNWADSGWIAVFKGVFIALLLAGALSWILTKVLIRFKLDHRITQETWRHIQVGTVCLVAVGHGLNDGLKYVGIFTLVLFTGGIITTFTVSPVTIIACAVVMAIGTLLGGYRIHRRLDGLVNGAEEIRTFSPFMGVTAELVAGLAIWQTGFLGIPMSTNHSVVSAMAGAKSARGKICQESMMKIIWGWIVTYFFCFTFAWFFASLFL